MMIEESNAPAANIAGEALPRQTSDTAPPVIRSARFEEILQLRYDVLRAGLPPDAAIFDGDREPTARHYGAFSESRNVGCATLHLNGWLDEPAWQLRGMATAPTFQGKGLGRAMLSFVESNLLATHSVHLLWCNARVPAAKFYHRLGWQVVSGEFEIPTAGPHVRMVKRL